MIPLSWNILSLWYGTQEDIGITYEQKYELIAHGNDILNDPSTAFGSQQSVYEFTIASVGERRPIIHIIFSFPVWIEGPYTLKLLLRKKGQEEEWREIATYPLVVEHSQKLPVPSPPPIREFIQKSS